MSLRNIRKVYGQNTLLPPEGNSDEEYEPLYARTASSKFTYEGLSLSSHSEASEHEANEGVATERISTETHSKKKKKKKKKQQKHKQITRSRSKENLDELDEIDKSVMEVNALLGTPPAALVSDTAEKPIDQREVLLAVYAKHLNPNNEMRKLFGPEEEVTRRRGRQPNLNRLLRKAVIVPASETFNFPKSGLSMSVLRREDNCTYFAFDHSKEYQRQHKAFLRLESYRNGNLIMGVEDAQRNMHVEAMLESADSMFRFEAYSSANTVIEHAIAYMQHVAHPSFNLADMRVRLEYKYLENRAFHVAIMKYMYLLSNRACHRTALELGKLLLNLDPGDPLAVLLVVDTLALRAREHRWLIDAVDYWTKERDAGFLFNIQYSNAMAHFHVATKNKEDVSKADELLMSALLRFPGVLFRLLQCASTTPSARLKECALFANADDNTGKNLKELMDLYAKLSFSKWREPPVFEWMLRVANTLAEKYNTDAALQERAKELANERSNLFRGWPDEIIRHLSVIAPMSNFIIEGSVPRVGRAQAANPQPPADGVSRYGYDRLPSAATHTSSSPLYELISSVLPHYALPLPDQFQRVMAAVAEDEAQVAGEGEGPDEAERRGVVDVELEVDDGDGDGDASDDDDGNDGDVHVNEDMEFVVSVGALTNAIRRFMDMYEAGAGGNAGADADADAGADAVAGAGGEHDPPQPPQAPPDPPQD